MDVAHFLKKDAVRIAFVQALLEDNLTSRLNDALSQRTEACNSRAARNS
jgi:hypothetical protein